MFKIVAFFMITQFVRLYVKVAILLACGKHLHDRIISLRMEACVLNTSLTPPLFIQMPVPIQLSKLHIFVCQGYRFCLCFYNFDIWVWNSTDSVVFFFIFFYYIEYGNFQVKEKPVFHPGKSQSKLSLGVRQ